jgi:hypothetical protein
MDKQHGQEPRICSTDMQNEHAARICGMDIGSMNIRHAAWTGTCSMDIVMAMQYRH